MAEPKAGVIAVRPGTKFSFVGKLPDSLTITIGKAGESTRIEFSAGEDAFGIAIEEPRGGGGGSWR